MALTNEQWQMRKTGVGGSEVAPVLGLSKYGTEFDVWASKQPDAQPVKANNAMRFGNHLEAAILAIYSEQVEPCTWAGNVTLRHPTVPFALATLDARVVACPRAVEAKAVGRFSLRDWGEELDAVPEQYICQAQWQMFVADLPECDVAALFCLDELKTYRLKRDDELCGMMIEEVGRFWRDHVVTGKPPTPSGSHRASEAIRARFPKETKPLLPWTGRAYALAHEVAKFRDDARHAGKLADAAANQLKLLIGDAAGFGDDERRVTWTANGKGSTRWEAVAREMGATPELIQKHRSQPSRVLRLKGFGEETEE
jgi:putative phage-type endonuclease